MEFQSILFAAHKRHLPKVLSHDEVLHILNSIQSANYYRRDIWGEWLKARDAAIAASMYYLGGRTREILWLLRRDLDIINDIIIIRGTTNKTGMDRVKRIPDELKPYLEHFLSFEPREYFWRLSPYLFPAIGGRRMSPSNYRRNWNRILKEAGLYIEPEKKGMPGRSPYVLRHSFCTHICEGMLKTSGSVDWKKIAEEMGWSTLDLRVMNTYEHLTDSSLDSQQRLVNSFLARNKPLKAPIIC